MNKLAFFAITILCAQASARSLYEIKATALVRDKKFKAQEKTVVLKDLLSTERFEGKYFRVVKGTSEEAVSFDDDKMLVFKAATVYHHLTKARDFYENKLSFEHIENMGQVTARIEITRDYSELGHYTNENDPPKYNNAHSFMPGEDFGGRLKPWGYEMWFRPPKKKHLTEVAISKSSNSMRGTLTALRKRNMISGVQRFIISILNHEVNDAPYSVENLQTSAASILLMEALYRYQDPINYLFTPKWYWLDTALVPEIIYHEYSHIVLSDYLETSHKSPVNEGMADYFAGRIANSPELGSHLKKYNRFVSKKAYRGTLYTKELETEDYSTSDFVFGVLWGLTDILGEKASDRLVYDMRKQINSSSTIRDGLIEGILETCQTSCPSPFLDSIRIRKALHQKNL